MAVHSLRATTALVLILATLAVAPAFAQSHGGASAPAEPPPPPSLDSGLGETRFKITTKSPQAQAYFDQGYRLLHAFNPEEAERSFREAIRLDPDCAMAEWGLALAMGHNINLPRLPDRDSVSHLAAQAALRLAAGASPRERDLIEALSHRTQTTFPSRPEDATSLDQAYADAMRKVAARYPNDADVLALFAEALMDVYPWRLWSVDLKPSPVTMEAIATLEKALQINPRHIGANHLYIHIIEPSDHPEKAVKSAEFLVNRAPDAGHLVHMPSHIFERVGRYGEAVKVNRDAVKVDEKYFTEPTAGMLYTPYLAHNRHFVSFVSMLEGRYGEALPAGRACAGTIPTEMHAEMPGMEFFVVVPYAIEVQFGRWDDILAEPVPPMSLIYTTAYWHFARGMAFAGKGQADAARAERDSLVFFRDALAEGATQGFNSAHDLLEIGRHLLESQIATASGDPSAAVEHARAAVAGERVLQYDEPPDWMLPTNLRLGTALLAAGRPAEAEQAFRRDLSIRPETGWGLTGLEQALAAQKKSAEAKKVAVRAGKAFERADAKITRASY